MHKVKKYYIVDLFFYSFCTSFATKKVHNSVFVSAAVHGENEFKVRKNYFFVFSLQFLLKGFEQNWIGWIGWIGFIVFLFRYSMQVNNYLMLLFKTNPYF